ncbi:hypothetical protein STRTUCAR8_01901 [Streptomyces turgidiscabies Car8]|uniref:Uncharacterized protein n=1 Tax=Streptomyces turgidiscabies (strain Car8) TaxID=698760 RepID=L7F5U1_STRT8|nr:hypothetical protein STRTUCAR8_01901 [Streptomyces turgidiscabies Car8]
MTVSRTTLVLESFGPQARRSRSKPRHPGARGPAVDAPVLFLSPPGWAARR